MEGEAIKESVVVETSESQKLAVDEHVENGEGEWFNRYSPFHISSALGIFRSSTQIRDSLSSPSLKRLRHLIKYSVYAAVESELAYTYIYM